MNPSETPGPGDAQRRSLSQVLNTLLPETSPDRVSHLRLCPNVETFVDRVAKWGPAVFEEIYVLVCGTEEQSDSLRKSRSAQAETEQALTEALEANGNLQSEKVALREEKEAFVMAIKKLSGDSAPVPPPAPTPTPTSTPIPAPFPTPDTNLPRQLSPAHPDPDHFTGDPQALNSFLLSMLLKLRQNADWYPTEQNRMIYFVSRLAGRGLDQVSDAIDSSGHIHYATVDALVAELETAFADVGRADKASRKILQARQGQSALSSFLPQWLADAKLSDLNDGGKIQCLKLALHPALLNRLTFCQQKFGSLKEYLEVVRDQDALLRSLDATYFRKNTSSAATAIGYQVSPSHTPAPASFGDPMDLSAAQLQPDFRIGTFDPATTTRRPVTSQERGARRDYAKYHHLCIYCLKPGHVLASCPTRPARLAGLTGTAAPTGETGNASSPRTAAPGDASDGGRGRY